MCQEIKPRDIQSNPRCPVCKTGAGFLTPSWSRRRSPAIGQASTISSRSAGVWCPGAPTACGASAVGELILLAIDESGWLCRRPE
jgi:hypothetical protein